MDIQAVFEAVPGSPVEHEVRIIERAEEISPASVGLTIAEGKALLASLQAQIVTAQVQQHAASVKSCPQCGDACKYPPAEPVALRLLAPQRGIFATVRIKSKNKSKSLVVLSSLPLQRQFKGGYTPGILKVLLPPRQSRGISLLD